MKKIIIISILLAFAGMMLAANAVAMLSATKGKVDLSRDARTLKFKNGELLRNDDELRTGGESFAAYKYIDGSSTIKVFSNSMVKIAATKSGKTLSKKVTVNKGSVLTSVKPKTGSLVVQTPTTVASVKGTQFLTKITDTDQSMFIVTEGEVELKILDQPEAKAVPKGKTAIVEEDGTYEIRNSTRDDLSAVEQAEMDSDGATETKTMLVPVIDASGRTKYIEISY
ncbi:MAG: FecR domain-containing protein [Candidatus Cloacimonetes bacterium]|nr:FecR domain-containing protein [Candidatus Cloacimonadota bacterium]